ncbi:CopD family protein [Novosphingobium clariflavum]|uniref:CopD family protein n=1 Tax=Novosphingobium clariflavum TaxID=2029884 RepID=A0ABV6S6V5_9SPHN|nr:CopD family protein [Novosphingobium clariflavum]
MENGSLVAARFVSYALLLMAAGLPFHALIAGPRSAAGARFGQPARLALAGLAAGAAAASLWWAMANVAAMAAIPLAELDRATFTAVIGATPLGTLLTVRAAALALFVAALVLRPAPALLAPPALAALASAAWAGHAGAGEALGGDLLRAGDVLHLAAAALWLGAMLAFLADMRGDGQATGVVRSLAAFARTGTLVVAVLLVTGLTNAWLISGGSWPSGSWPRLIALKIVLFALMLGLAARNRWILVPALEARMPGAARRLARSLVLEMSCGLAVVLVVAAAGLLDPHGV